MNERVKFGYWELDESGGKQCHDEKPAWWDLKARAAIRAGLGYCGYDESHQQGGAAAWSDVFDSYEIAYEFWVDRRVPIAELDAREDDTPSHADLEAVIKEAARVKYGIVLSLISTAEGEYRIVIMESDPEYPAYPALTISAFLTPAGVKFDKPDYYLTVRAALDQLDHWEAAERERLARLMRPTRRQTDSA